MDSEGSPGFFTMGTSFLSEAGRETSHSHGESAGFDPFTSIKSRQGLFRSGNQELVFIFLLFSRDGIQVLLEVRNLTCLLHYALLQEIGRLEGGILLLDQELHTIIEEGHIQKGTESLQIVASMAGGILTFSLFDTVDHVQNFMMMGSSKLSLSSNLNAARFTPGLDDRVLALINAFRDSLMNQVTNASNEGIKLFKNRSFLILSNLDSVFNFLDLCNFISAWIVLISFLLITDSLVGDVILFSQLITDESLFSPFFIKSHNIIDYFGVLASLIQGLLDDFGIATFLWSKEVNI
mmetsp:Transcript_20739/g.18157  ORF Transcript_20739/g.18157 Transcript_20739/m.18157 type:complete len:294 (+) Transcript_20739:219-1100(+)